MHRFRFSRVWRWPAILVMLAAWMLVSNRCAMFQLSAAGPVVATAEVHHCCHQDGAPASSRHEKTPMPAGSECCQSVRALALDPVASLAKSPVPVLYFTLAWAEISSLEEAMALVEKGPTSGPPGHETFAERILHRSLQSHAPPAVV